MTEKVTLLLNLIGFASIIFWFYRRKRVAWQIGSGAFALSYAWAAVDAYLTQSSTFSVVTQAFTAICFLVICFVSMAPAKTLRD